MSHDSAESRSRLFSAGERLGWEFRDRLRFWRHFPEPEPKAVVADPELADRLARLAARRQSALTWAVAGAVAALLAAWYLLSNVGPGDLSAGGVLAALAILAALWLCVWRPLRLGRAEHRLRRSLEGLQVAARSRSDGTIAGWRARADAHNAAEWSRVNEIPEWGAVRSRPAGGRVDVFGGSLRSWEGLLTTLGASLVASSPRVLVLDLSEGLVAEELCQLAAATGRAVSAQVLPRQQASSDLVADLDAGQLADVLVESIHGDRAEPDREARAMDARILGAVCAALAPDLSLARVHEALLAAMREPGRPQHLSAEEWTRVTGLFSAEYVQQAHGRFRSLEAHLHPLRELGARAAGPPASGAHLRCLAVGGDEQLFATGLFVDLATQWAIRGLRAESGAGTLVVAGADRLRRRHLERLADVCDRMGVRLVYLFRHLREDAEQLLGGAGTAAFMRLGNHLEAERAARFIGLGHRFVLSRVTRSHGGAQMHTAGESVGESAGESREAGQLLPTATRSRSWGATRSYAEGLNWHYAETSQRVYEYIVEPTALQNLPDYALLVVQHGQGLDPGAGQLAASPRIQVADCNPDILSLPRVLTEPFPEEEGQALPPAGAPSPLEGEGWGGGYDSGSASGPGSSV